MAARSLRRRLRTAVCLILACACAFFYLKMPASVPVQYEKWEKVAREQVRKTLNAKGVHDVSNSTLGVRTDTPTPSLMGGTGASS